MRLAAGALLLAVSLLATGAGGAQKRQKKAAPPPDQMTGCLDEQPGPQYILRDQDVKVVAVLEPDGFKPEIFAQFLGNRVKVTGKLDRSVTPPRMRVRIPERLANHCRPE
jgi:hypothetical protein